MDLQVNIKQSKNPKEYSNILSKLLFYYMWKIVRKTAQEDFGYDTIFEPLPDFKSETLGMQFEKLWIEKRRNCKSTQNRVGIGGLFLILVKMFWRKFLIYNTLIILCKIILTVFQPMIFGKIVAHFRVLDTNIYYLGISIVIINVINSLVSQHYFQANAEISLQMAVALSSAIYRKTVRLSNTVDSDIESKVGNVVTLITKDVFSFGYLNYLFSNGLVAVITISVQMAVVYKKLGWIGLLPFVISVAFIIFEIFLGKLIQTQRYKECIYAAQRISVLKQAFSLIQIVKMSTFEDLFINKCNKYRKKEVYHLLNVSFIRTTNQLLGKLGCAASFVLTVLIYYSVMGEFSAEKLFFLSSSLEVIRAFFNFILPIGISRSAESIAGLKRVEQYFSINDFSLDNSRELNKCYNMDVPKPIVKAQNLHIKIKNKILIKNLNFEILDGLLVVTGPVGSGKTTFLKTIIGELQVEPKNVYVRGSLSYASQEPWLFPGTIRQNILFGQEYNGGRYKEVVERCALSYDFSKFPKGDQTLVVDNGINLSRGQKMRISLARAVYQNKQIYLLDSVFTGIDMKTNKFIFQKVIMEFLKSKICILISGDPYHCQRASQILRFSKDTFVELIPNKLATNDLYLENYNAKEFVPNNTDTEVEYSEHSNLLKEKHNKTKNMDIPYIYKENHKTGNIHLSTYKTYIKFCGGSWIILCLLLLYLLSQIGLIISQKFMSIWIDSEEKLYSLSKDMTFNGSKNYLNVLNERNKTFQIYLIGFIFYIFLHITVSFLTMYIFTRAAKNIHTYMVKSVIYAQMDFFCTTLLGTILNRFSKDINCIDEILPTLIYNMLTVTFDCIGLFTMIALAQWMHLIPILIINIVAFIVLRFILIPVATKAKRLEAALHSPMVGYLNSTLNGLDTIRILGPSQNKLVQEFDYHQDLFASAFYISFCTERVLKIFLQISCNILLAVVVFYFILSNNSKPGDVGLGIGKNLIILRIIDYSISRYMDIETQLTSLERIYEYLSLPQENRSGLELHKDATLSGNIQISNLNLFYKSTKQQVLKNFNLSVKSGEKIAIVGRTGCGKSSLISCIFRIYNYSGNLILNNIDIKRLTLKYLRSQISVISQDAIIFSGSLRENIDPLQKYSDSEIIFLISNISSYFKNFGYKSNKNIIGFISNCNINLDIQINRDALSKGEIQVINLLRVMLSRKSIVILDELSEDLDKETSQTIQKIIEDHFKNCTVFQICHKVTNLKNFNKICVIVDGKIVEFNTPNTLLNCQNSS